MTPTITHRSGRLIPRTPHSWGDYRGYGHTWPCRGCAAPVGTLHVLGCHFEHCPLCREGWPTCHCPLTTEIRGRGERYRAMTYNEQYACYLGRHPEVLGPWEEHEDGNGVSYWMRSEREAG